jgi:hypothetical protein
VAAASAQRKPELTAVVDDLSSIAGLSNASQQQFGKPVLGRSIGGSLAAFHSNGPVWAESANGYAPFAPTGSAGAPLARWPTYTIGRDTTQRGRIGRESDELPLALVAPDGCERATNH